jgi:hypothetical protein
MARTTSFDTAYLTLLYNNTNIANIGDTTGLRGASAAGNLYFALFTADPTATGSITNEANYTSYTRIAVPRTSGGFTITSNVASNAAEVAFPKCTGGTNTITHFGICTGGTSGVADLIATGALTSSVIISNNITPKFAIGAFTVTAS